MFIIGWVFVLLRNLRKWSPCRSSSRTSRARPSPLMWLPPKPSTTWRQRSMTRRASLKINFVLSTTAWNYRMGKRLRTTTSRKRARSGWYFIEHVLLFCHIVSLRFAYGFIGKLYKCQLGWLLGDGQHKRLRDKEEEESKTAFIMVPTEKDFFANCNF